MNLTDINTQIETQIETIAQSRLDRRKFFRQAGYFGLGAAATGLALSGSSAKAQGNANQTQDTIAEIFTAFLIAEDLATTFYYNGLVGAVIQDPALAGPGGTAANIRSTGNVGNVNYLQAALIQEIEHANLFRTYLGDATGTKAGDPVANFYFPAGTFDTLGGFLPILNALENAFIGAYIVLIQELTYKATLAGAGALTGVDAKFTAKQYQLFAKTAGSILGVESEHRVLGRVIGNQNPANNYNYEQTDGLTSIYNGAKTSAVAALTPFLSASSSFPDGFPLATALANRRMVTGNVVTSGGQPTA
jgi:hypothetical protein